MINSRLTYKTAKPTATLIMAPATNNRSFAFHIISPVNVGVPQLLNFDSIKMFNFFDNFSLIS